MQFFRKRAKKGQKRAKYLKTSTRMYKIRKYSEKGQGTGNYCKQGQAIIARNKMPKRR